MPGGSRSLAAWIAWDGGDQGQEQAGDGARDQALASGERRPQVVVVVTGAALEIAGGLSTSDWMPSALILLWN